MHPLELALVDADYYESLSPRQQGWFSRIQRGNENIPHSCPYPGGDFREDEWRLGWAEAYEDLVGGEPYLIADWLNQNWP